MIARRVVWLGIVAALATSGISEAATSRSTKRCQQARAGTLNGADLFIDGDAESVAVGGIVDATVLATVRRGIARLRNSGRTVCSAYRVGKSGQQDIDVVEAQVNFYGFLHGGDTVKTIWGGGGLTSFGWLHDDTFERLGAPGRNTSVGRLDSLPAPVYLKVEFVDVTRKKPVQFEQFHPKAGPITLETSSQVWLEACPGGWRGAAPEPNASWGPQWPPGNCITFRSGAPAKLPNAWNDSTHLSVAIKAKDRAAKVVEITLRYTAVDIAGQCFISGVERACQPHPDRTA